MQVLFLQITIDFMKKKLTQISLFVFLVAVASNAVAQFSETISADRPGQAFSPFSVGNLVFQTQTGMDGGGYSVKKVDYQAQIKGGLFIPNTFLRFGLTEHFEINSFWAYAVNSNSVGDSSFKSNGLINATLGARINIYEGNEMIPAVGMLVTFRLPIMSPSYQIDNVAPSIVLMAGNNITDKLSYVLNFGINFNGNNAQPDWTYVANLSYSISPKFGTFVENYGFFNGTEYWNSWDTGLSFLVNNNLQLDINGGAGYNYNNLDYFASIGCSWRILSLREQKDRN